MATDLVYYKRNVRYVVGGRFFPTDSQGWTMTNDNPYVSVHKDKLREFKLANKRAILEGLIVESPEPGVDWETENAITDEEAVELVKNYLQLKQKLDGITSFTTALKLLDIAKEGNRPTKTIKLIESKVEELRNDEDDFGFREDNKGDE